MEIKNNTLPLRNHQKLFFLLNKKVGWKSTAHFWSNKNGKLNKLIHKLEKRQSSLAICRLVSSKTTEEENKCQKMLQIILQT